MKFLGYFYVRVNFYNSLKKKKELFHHNKSKMYRQLLIGINRGAKLIAEESLRPSEYTDGKIHGGKIFLGKPESSHKPLRVICSFFSFFFAL